tara:strand:+ start:1556 stop:1783 length:228 start_codon:yes stop_codon:yes gene_type:complete
MNLTQYQTELFVTLLDRLFEEFDEYHETKVFADNISTDDLEELWMLREKLHKALMTHENDCGICGGNISECHCVE